MMKLLVVVLLGIAIWYLFYRKRHQQVQPALVAGEPDMHELLQAHVRFYQDLEPGRQERFRRRVQDFLDKVAITPVRDVVIRPLDRLYVAASAIIPIFSFDDWRYNNLNEVLIYDTYFTKDFDQEAAHKNVMGMVGDGAMHRMMILSLPALRAGFEQNGSGNTGIHEFVHLLDKADGATDGVPEYMLPHELVQPWLRYAHQAIREIRREGSDINPYAATNEAEFFAVISEYFFQKPGRLKEHHPELYALLEQIYRFDPDWQADTAS